jgi:hypothetical protein
VIFSLRHENERVGARESDEIDEPENRSDSIISFPFSLSAKKPAKKNRALCVFDFFGNDSKAFFQFVIFRALHPQKRFSDEQIKSYRRRNRISRQPENQTIV